MAAEGIQEVHVIRILVTAQLAPLRDREWAFSFFLSRADKHNNNPRTSCETISLILLIDFSRGYNNLIGSRVEGELGKIEGPFVKSQRSPTR